MRAPLAPIGWPRAIAPPLRFVRSGGSASSARTATVWAANASVDLETVHFVHRPAEPPEQRPDRRNRSHHDPLRIEAGDRLPGDPGQAGAGDVSRTAASETITSAAAPVVHPRRSCRR